MSKKKDKLSSLNGIQACPRCACLMEINSAQCPECGTFLSREILDYEPEIPRDYKSKNTPKKIVDPTHYSLNPSSQIPTDEIEDEDIEDMTKEWHGGTSDFKFEEE